MRYTSLSIAWFLSLAACSATLEQAVKKTLPSTYKVRKPPNSMALLGSVVVEDNRLIINDCYGGILAPIDPSWSAVSVKYTRAASTDVAADFGGAVSVGAAGGGSVTGTITLSDTAIYELKELFFLPSSACATDGARRASYARPGGAEDRVVVRAVRAASVAVENTSSTSTDLKVTVPASAVVVHGGVTVNTEDQVALEGTNLFFAEQIATIKTTLTELDTVELSTGQATEKLGPCWVKLKSVSSDEWTAELACEDGVARPVKGEINGLPAYERTGKGVSYSIAVRSTATVGVYAVSYSRWVVVG